MKKIISLFFILLCGLPFGCSKKKVHVSTPVDKDSAASSEMLEETVGYASWYGDPYHGRRTSNGEIYNKFEMTAAHRTLPFDSVVKGQ